MGLGEAAGDTEDVSPGDVDSGEEDLGARLECVVEGLSHHS